MKKKNNVFFMFQPIIKWSGSKRSQSEEIIKYYPIKIDTYYEPFIGGGSMLRCLLDSNISCNHYIASDINTDLISLWNTIKTNPKELSEHYRKLWNDLNTNGDKARQRAYFVKVRERFNKEKYPGDFLFIMRTTTNGMPRYNSNGDFNNSFHITRSGIIPDTLDKVLYEWSDKLNKNMVEFVCQSYEDIKPKENDFVYLDPPYANTKGMYYGGIDNQELFDFLRNLKCPWVMSYDGKSGDDDRTYLVPEDIYDKHEYILSGNSSFKRITGNSKDSIVYESLYIKGCDKKDTMRIEPLF